MSSSGRWNRYGAVRYCNAALLFPIGSGLSPVCLGVCITSVQHRRLCGGNLGARQMRQPWCRWQRRYEDGCCASPFGSRLVSHHVAEPMCAAGTALACSAALCSAARPPAEWLPWRQRTCVWMPVLQLQNRPWLVVVSWQRPTADSPRLSRTVLGKSAPSQHHRRQVVGLIRLAECVAVRGC